MATHQRFELGATETYRRRTALWVGGAGTGDGVLVISVYPNRNSALPASKCYWVEVTGDVVLVWETAGGERVRFYKVTDRRCGCDGMRKFGAKPCKHKAAIDRLLASGGLRRPAGWGSGHEREELVPVGAGGGQSGGG